MRPIIASCLLLCCASFVVAYPSSFECTRSMAVGEVKPMDAPNTIVEGDDRSIDKVGGATCGGTLETGITYEVEYTLPSDSYQWLMEAKGVSASFDAHESGCADRRSGTGVTSVSVSFEKAGTVTFQMLASLGNNDPASTKAAPLCTFTVTVPSARPHVPTVHRFPSLCRVFIPPIENVPHLQAKKFILCTQFTLCCTTMGAGTIWERVGCIFARGFDAQYRTPCPHYRQRYKVEDKLLVSWYLLCEKKNRTTCRNFPRHRTHPSWAIQREWPARDRRRAK